MGLSMAIEYVVNYPCNISVNEEPFGQVDMVIEEEAMHSVSD